jgi:hypothetical protein
MESTYPMKNNNTNEIFCNKNTAEYLFIISVLIHWSIELNYKLSLGYLYLIQSFLA